VKAQGVIYLPGFKISPAPEMKTKKLYVAEHLIWWLMVVANIGFV